MVQQEKASMSMVSMETEFGFTPQRALEDEQHRVSPTLRQSLLTV